jgi:hypothetical protein
LKGETVKLFSKQKAPSSSGISQVSAERSSSHRKRAPPPPPPLKLATVDDETRLHHSQQALHHVYRCMRSSISGSSATGAAMNCLVAMNAA